MMRHFAVFALTVFGLLLIGQLSTQGAPTKKEDLQEQIDAINIRLDTLRSPLVVVDSRDEVVGQVTDGGPRTASVIVDVEGTRLRLGVTPERIHGLSVIYFESIDCTGPGFVRESTTRFPDPAVTFFPRASIGPPEKTIYVQVQNAVFETATTTSLFDPFVEACLPASGVRSDLIRLEPLIDLNNLGFTAPFSLEP